MTSRRQAARAAASVAILATLSGCWSAHAPKTRYAPTLNPIFVTESPLTGIDYETLGRVSVGYESGYGGDGVVKERLAQEAKKSGADAVIGVSTWHEIGWMGSWAAPHAAGTAIKFKGKAPDLSKLNGQWY
jgi:hypothetical protein